MIMTSPGVYIVMVGLIILTLFQGHGYQKYKQGGDVAQLLEPLTQVWFAGVAGDFSPRVNFQCVSPNVILFDWLGSKHKLTN